MSHKGIRFISFLLHRYNFLFHYGLPLFYTVLLINISYKPLAIRQIYKITLFPIIQWYSIVVVLYLLLPSGLSFVVHRNVILTIWRNISSVRKCNFIRNWFWSFEFVIMQSWENICFTNFYQANLNICIIWQVSNLNKEIINVS